MQAALRRPEESLTFVFALGALFLFLFGTFSWSMLEPSHDPFLDETPVTELALTVAGRFHYDPSPPHWPPPAPEAAPDVPAAPEEPTEFPDPVAVAEAAGGEEDGGEMVEREIPAAVGAAPPEWIPGARWIHPLPTSRISSDFGPRRRRFHSGLDLAAPKGTEILASRDGVVVYASWRARYGRLVVIDHGNGMTTRYGHCSKILVAPGARVTAGTPIAEVGSTGRSTGNHLHFEIRRDGHALDPGPILAHS